MGKATDFSSSHIYTVLISISTALISLYRGEIFLGVLTKSFSNYFFMESEDKGICLRLDISESQAHCQGEKRPNWECL